MHSSGGRYLGLTASLFGFSRFVGRLLGQSKCLQPSRFFMNCAVLGLVVPHGFRTFPSPLFLLEARFGTVHDVLRILRQYCLLFRRACLEIFLDCGASSAPPSLREARDTTAGMIYMHGNPRKEAFYRRIRRPSRDCCRQPGGAILREMLLIGSQALFGKSGSCLKGELPCADSRFRRRSASRRC
jgi:hypothetical protein